MVRVQLQALVRERARGHDLRLEPRQAMAHGLHLGQRPAERLPLVHVLARPLVAGLRARGGHVRDDEPLLRQLLHEHVEAVVQLAQQVGSGQPDAVEEELARVLGLHAHLLQVLPALEALHALFHQEQRDAVRTLLRVRFGHHDHNVRHLPVGDEHLGTVQNEVISVGHSARADALQVAPGTWLRHRDGANQLTARHRGQQPLLLLSSAIVEDVRHHDL
mmetsp:Transcript_14977/g.47766  ORF Transcript_14977/g.47766 Transcript_14977/m.47766 type:complete len:219 (+) Transcript_14977:236-892(+)